MEKKHKKNQHFAATILVILITINAYVNAASKLPIYSTKLIHRFSAEIENNKTTPWPEKKSFAHMRILFGNDLKRQRLKLGAQNQLFAASQNGQTYNYGNELGWLHYAWIDIGTPSNSYLVGLDTGSDMFWVPCDCIDCAPLSLSYYTVLDKELKEYSPSHSSSSKHIPCNHELCEMGPRCETPKGHCPYAVNYLSENTSSSGLLFEDQLHLSLVGGNKLQNTTRASIILGCGSRQSGQYLEGIAPDGLMGLGPGDISVPSLLAKSRLINHSFSFCYDKSYSGRLFFGDQGPTSQKSTSFLPLEGYSMAYFVEVETYCVGSTCLKQTGYRAQVDTGSSFTFLPKQSYEQVLSEFHRQVNATRITVQDFENCYKARSLKLSNIPSLKLVFSKNQSFLIENPMLHIIDDEGDFYCLGLQSVEADFGIIGQNFMMGYRMVFDWENMKLGWSTSNCKDIGDDEEPPSGPSPNPLPTNEQQQSPHPQAVAPAVAVRAPPNPSQASPPLSSFQYFATCLLLLLCTAYKITYV